MPLHRKEAGITYECHAARLLSKDCTQVQSQRLENKLRGLTHKASVQVLKGSVRAQVRGDTADVNVQRITVKMRSRRFRAWIFYTLPLQLSEL